MPFRSIVPADLAFADRYRLLTCAVQPRPIALVGTLDAGGEPNLAPFSFFMVGGVNPASLLFCPTLNGACERKDSLRNVEASGEFSVNVPDRALERLFAESTERYPKTWEGWAARGVSLARGKAISAPLLDECPVRFECRLHTVVAHGDGPHAANYVIGEVVLAHVHERLFEGDELTIERFAPIARLGGADYLDVEVLERFDPARPNAASVSSVDL